ncbi:MAG: hypothetical protein WC531_02305 [Candidatus Paceibacterota bacterium]
MFGRPSGDGLKGRRRIMNYPVVSLIVFGAELPLGQLIVAELLGQHRAVWAIVRGDKGLVQDLFNTWLTGLHCDGQLEVSQWEPGESNPTVKTIADWDPGWSRDCLGRRTGFDALVFVQPRSVASVDQEECLVCDWTRSRLAEGAIIVLLSDAGDDNPTKLRWVLRCLGLKPSPSRPLALVGE